MTLDAAAALRMKIAADESGLKLSVAHYRRQQPMFLKIKQLLKDEAIGDVRFIRLQMLQPANSDIIAPSESNWRLDPKISGGGLFHDLAPHQLDLMVYYFGKPLRSAGIAVNQAGLYEADDLVTGQILFEHDVVFTGTWCFNVSKQDQLDICEIIGSAGSMSFPMFGHELKLRRNGTEEQIAFEPLQHVQQPMIEQVVEYFLGRRDNPSSADDALLSMQLLDSFTAS
jgi:predicted dehydrogenase